MPSPATTKPRFHPRVPVRLTSAYHYLITVPDRCYPFRTEIEGQWVRGWRSYDQAVAQYRKRTNSTTGFGYRIDAYRQLFHLLGSFLIIIGATFISRNLFGSDTALFILLGLAFAFITYQEFSLQPRTYNQHWQKGLADWAVWLVPMGYYVFVLVTRV
jgi:hypothetical protein